LAQKSYGCHRFTVDYNLVKNKYHTAPTDSMKGVTFELKILCITLQLMHV
jgi:hypothetical protein